MQFAVDFRLPDFKRILVNKSFHPFLVRDKESSQVVALSNWKVTEPEKSSRGVISQEIEYRPLSRKDEWRSWVYWTYDKLSKLLPNWLYRIFRPEKASIYDRKSRWFAKVLSNFNRSILETDKKLGYWTLMHLGVHPQFGGQGIASALLQWGLDKADNEDRSIYIIATIAGSRLYSKHGFQAVSKDVYFPGEPHGGFEEIIMRRARLSERK